MESIVVLILTVIITISVAKVMLSNTTAYSSDGIAGIIKVYLSSLLTIGIVSFGVSILIVSAIEKIFKLLIDYWYITLLLVYGVIWLFNKYKEDSSTVDDSGSVAAGSNLATNIEIQKLPSKTEQQSTTKCNIIPLIEDVPKLVNSHVVEKNSAKKFCMYCGTQLEIKDRFCSGCGKKNA